MSQDRYFQFFKKLGFGVDFARPEGPFAHHFETILVPAGGHLESLVTFCVDFVASEQKTEKVKKGTGKAKGVPPNQKIISFSLFKPGK